MMKVDLITKPVGHDLPIGHRQNQAEMADGHTMTIDRTRTCRLTFLRRKMGNDLVSMKVEIHPGIAAAPFGAPQKATVETPRFGQIVYRKCQMERRDLRIVLLCHQMPFACRPKLPRHCNARQAICLVPDVRFGIPRNHGRS